MSRILLALILSVTSVARAADHADPKSIDGLRGTFPAGSIDSATRADAALDATAGAKEQVEKDHRVTAQECLTAILVNDCLDRARAVQRRRTADIEAVELEANRYKRREHGDRIDADRRTRETERQAKEPADTALRAGNRDSFAARQAQAQRDAAARERAQAGRTVKPRRPVSRAPSTPPDVAAAQRAKNAADYAAKVKQAAEHQAEITRRVAAKGEERKRKADAKAAKDAKEAAAMASRASAAAKR